MISASHGGPAPSGDLVFVGDAHLERHDASLREFLNFLDRLALTSGRIVLLGDLFNVWIGRRELEGPHHRAVVAKLAELRRRGRVVRYVEGNRDYRIGPCYAGHALDDASEEGIVERFGGHRIFAIHGDRANVSDRQYRLWRRLSRSAAVWRLFHALPASLRLRLADWLETRFRGTNLEFKQALPVDAIRAYATPFLESGHGIVVLGHFHVEREIRSEPPGPRGRILVLPEWKGSRRHLRVEPGGEVEFVDSES